MTERYSNGEGFHSVFVDGQSLKLHIMHNGTEPENLGSDPRPVFLFLHGFPESWIAWRTVFEKLAKDFLVIAPDQRGFGKSDAPKSKEHYKTGLMVADMIAVMSELVGTRKFHLAGHDWGASVAYALAMAHPDRVASLIIANGVHPVCFQNALSDHITQANASQYMNLLASPQASNIMSADNFAKTFGMFENFSKADWLNDELREEYRQSWSGEGRMEAMLNWYSSSPIVVPTENDDGRSAPLYHATDEKFNIVMPHLVIWGMEDQALTPFCLEGLDNFATKLEIVRLNQAGHWLLHSHGEMIAGLISGYISQNKL